MQAGDVVGDAEEVEPVEQRRHVAAGDRQAARLAEDRRHVGAVRGDDVALGRPPALDELADDVAAAIELPWSRSRTASSAELDLVVDIGPSPGRRASSYTASIACAEPQLVEVLQVAQPAATLDVGGGELGVALRRCPRPRA